MRSTDLHLVCLSADGEKGKPRQHVGPFPDEPTARDYADRLEKSSNGTVRAVVAPLINP